MARLLPTTPETLTVARTLTPLRAFFDDLKGKNVADDHRTGRSLQMDRVAMTAQFETCGGDVAAGGAISSSS